MISNRVRFSSSQFLFTLAFLVFFFTLFNGYVQNLIADYRANAWLVLIGVIFELGLVVYSARRWIEIEVDALEIAGFLLVVFGVWLYFILPALPTLLPPTQSSDAVRVYLQVLFSYPEGKLVSWYPAGGAFVAAMFARWLDWAPLRILHPTAASFVALSAGAVYGMTCAILPRQRLSKIVALIAPALLFVPWSYFAGTINWEQYFFAQVFAQYFILAALWYIASYTEQPRWVFAVLIGAALLSVVAAYPIFVALPLALFGLIALVRVAQNRSRGVLITLGIFLTAMLVAAIALQRGGILELVAGQKSIILSVGEGGVASPSLENLGGPILLALVVLGIGWAWKQGAFGRTIFGLLFVWLLQLGALLIIQPWLSLSDYRVDKTFYLLVFPFAILATLPIAWASARLVNQLKLSSPMLAAGFIVMYLALGASVFMLRPPKAFSPLTESELRVAVWAKEFYSETYQIAYLDDSPVSAYWLAFGLWREKLPNEWFQWIPAGRKMGPATFDEWREDPGWHDRLLVRYIEEIPVGLRVVYRAGSAAILDKDVPADLGPKPTYRSDLNYGTTLTLIGYEIPRMSFQPGETISLTTVYQSLYPPPATVAWRTELVDSVGRVIQRIERDPFNNKYPLQRWAPGKFARQAWTIPLDANLAPGVYEIRESLFRRADGEFIDARPMYSIRADPPMPSPTMARIKIPAAPPSADELRAAKSMQARFGENATLLSYTLNTDRATRQINLKLFWQAFSKMSIDYTAFVHILDASGKVVAQRDASPRNGTYPTSIWDVGEIVTDEYVLIVPPDARAPFIIEIGLYEQPSLKRVPVNNSDHLEIKLLDF